MYKQFIQDLDRFFQSRNQHFDAFYFYWTSLAYVICLGNELSIDVAGALQKVMMQRHADEYAKAIIQPVMEEDVSYQNFISYMHFGNDLYDLGPLWREVVLRKDQDGLEKLCLLLKTFLSLIDEDRRFVLKILEKEHENFRTTFYKQYRRSNEKAYKDYVRKVRYTMHTFIIASELIELLE